MIRPPELQRLRKRSEFLAASRAGKSALGGLVLQARKRDDDAPARAGFTVTKKVGNAVIRNRARRRLKEAAREILPLLGKAGYDYVLVGRQSTLKRAWPALLDDLRQALAKIHRIASTAEKPHG
ncbi:MAG: ribonuclease P protein component [Parvibaculaceae bacterium]